MATGIETDERQLRVRAGDDSAGRCVEWGGVRRVVAAKRDLFGRDLVCLFFEVGPDAVLELDESMAGWQDLLTALPLRLPGALPADEWVMRVLFPAFAGAPIEIFARP